MSSKSLLLWLFIAIFVFIAYLVIKHRLKHKTETITCFTGGLGSGKTLLSVDKALNIYSKQLNKVKFKNFIRRIFKKEPLELPILLSNMPVIIKKNYLKKKNNLYCYKLTAEHLLLQERIPLGSVILIDELSAFANQFDFNQQNVIRTFDEFVRLFRHYTKGGYIVCNDQCSNNINLVIRRRVNVVHNLCNCYVFWRFCFYYERMISISEEIKTEDSSQGENSNDTQNNMNFRFKFLWRKNNYDTYCYSERYNSVPYKKISLFSALKCFSLLRCPKDKEKKYIPKTKGE